MSDGGADRFRLLRAQRLQQTRDFTRIRNEGRRLVHGSLIANWMMNPQGKTSRVGVVVSRKVGESVTRNRVRRLIREACRLHLRELTGAVDLVLVARASIVGKPYAAVEADFIRLMRKAGLLASIS